MKNMFFLYNIIAIESPLDMKSEKLLLCAAAVVAIIVICMYMHHTKEGYNNQPLSGMNYMRRTPVTYALKTNGMSENPHYRADTGDKLVPLEYSTINFWDPSPHKYPPPVRRATEIANDSKTRLDLVEAGDMGWYRYLWNIPQSDYPAPLGTVYEADAVDIDKTRQPLYDPSFHYDDILGN